MAKETTSAAALLHTDDPNAPAEFEGYDVQELAFATSGFCRMFYMIAAASGADVAISALMSAVVSIGPRVLEEDELARLLREAAEKLPCIYARNVERNRRAAETNRAELDKLN